MKNLLAIFMIICLTVSLFSQHVISESEDTAIEMTITNQAAAIELYEDHVDDLNLVIDYNELKVTHYSNEVHRKEDEVKTVRKRSTIQVIVGICLFIAGSFFGYYASK